MDAFKLNFHHGGKFIVNGGSWLYVGGQLGYIDISDLDKWSYFELEKEVKKLYPSLKSIAYLKSGMTFNEGLTFLTNDNDCWIILTWVSDESIEV